MLFGLIPMIRAISGFPRVALIARPRGVYFNTSVSPITSTNPDTTCHRSSQRNDVGPQWIGVRRLCAPPRGAGGAPAPPRAGRGGGGAEGGAEGVLAGDGAAERAHEGRQRGGGPRLSGERAVGEALDADADDDADQHTEEHGDDVG